jgi:hypothetical protein
MDEQTTTPDLTRLFAPEDLWPDPSDCPEWPVYPDAFNASMNGPRTRQDAESRLYSLSRQLHGNETPRDPTPAEKQTAHERFFAEPTPGNWKNWQFQALGLTFRPANHSVEAQARAAVEAAHVRGWLRKLDAAAELESKRKRDAEQARLQSKVKSWPEREAATAAELERLQEGEKRHLQRIADEKAYYRARDLRAYLEGGRREAVQAAQSLGIDLPAPEVEEALVI